MNTNIDWPSFLSRHDPIWEKLPERWTDGAFIGNGRLGAMIYKGDGEAEEGAEVLAWTIGRSDLYDNRNQEDFGSLYENYRVPIGRFHLCPVGKTESGTIRIDLWNGEATGSIKTDCGNINWKSWVVPGDANGGVIVIDLETDDGESGTTWKWQPFESRCPRSHTRPQEGYHPNPEGSLTESVETKVWVQPFLIGGDYSTAWSEEATTPLTRTLFISVADGLHKGNSKNLAIKAIGAARTKGLPTLNTHHRTWWHEFYPRSFISIPDARIEGHYWLQLYKMASATREGTSIVDTCGPWLKVDTVWPAVWWNLNVQLFHYPIPVANQMGLNEPLIRLLKQELNNGNLIRNAPEEMQHDSAFFGNPTTTSSLLNNSVYWDGKQGNRSGTARKAVRLNHLPWVCHTVWEEYRRTMDPELLEELLFPLTRVAYSLIFHFLEEREDGRLHIKDVYSSEYGAADDANEAIAMIHWGCHALLWMCDRMQLKDPDIPRWKDILARLVEPPVDRYGLMIGSDTSFTVTHRHYSHLMYLLPFRIWNCEDPKLRDLAEHSLKHFLRKRNGLAGYSYTGGASMYAILGDGDEALNYLKQYYHIFDRPSTMYTEASPESPVMETPPSAARVVQDMLLQSHDVIRVFPAVPTKWKDACFHNLLAEGAFEISASKKDSQTQFVRIKSLAGEPCKLSCDIDHPTCRINGKELSFKRDERGHLELNLRKGEEVLVFPVGKEPIIDIQPVDSDPRDHHYYGVKERS